MARILTSLLARDHGTGPNERSRQKLAARLRFFAKVSKLLRKLTVRFFTGTKPLP
jgi:hypothetical protein